MLAVHPPAENICAWILPGSLKRFPLCFFTHLWCWALPFFFLLALGMALVSLGLSLLERAQPGLSVERPAEASVCNPALLRGACWVMLKGEQLHLIGVSLSLHFLQVMTTGCPKRYQREIKRRAIPSPLVNLGAKAQQLGSLFVLDSC